MPYTTALSFSPLALADIDHSVMIGGEYRFRKKWAVVADAGYVFTSDYFEHTKRTSGINSRTSMRYYRGWKNNEFWQLQILFKQVSYTLHDWLGKNCVNGVPAYDELQDFKFRKEVFGINLMAGDIRPIFSDQFFLEINLGFGVRYKRQGVHKIENACYDYSQMGLVNAYEDKIWAPSIPFSLKVYYVIK